MPMQMQMQMQKRKKNELVVDLMWSGLGGIAAERGMKTERMAVVAKEVVVAVVRVVVGQNQGSGNRLIASQCQCQCQS